MLLALQSQYSVTAATQPVRYIRDSLNGSSGNAASYWVEIQAFDAYGNNVALNKTVTANFTPVSPGTLSQVTDGVTDTNSYVTSSVANSQVVVDLGSTLNIASVTRFHYYGDGRTFFGTKTETSTDNVNWTVIFDSNVSSTYAETSLGRNDATRPAPTALSPAQVGSLIPAYTYAAADWTTYTNTANTVPSIAILNPSTGPGTTLDTTYASYAHNYRQAGGKIHGYISTSYAGTVNTARTVAAVKADVDTYISLGYKIDGFFLDEMTTANTTANVSYYSQVFAYIKNKGLYVVSANPGQNVDEIYCSLPLADILNVYEGTVANFATYATPTWQGKYPAFRFGWIIYAGASTDVSNVLSRARNEGVKYIFVTNGVAPNPYSSAPSFWSSEESAKVGKIYFSAFLLNGGDLKQIAKTQLGTGLEPAVFYNNVIKIRTTTEGVPIIWDGERNLMRQISASETLLI